MPQFTCSRCFAVFESEPLRAGQAPLCPDCAPASATAAAQAARARPPEVAERPVPPARVRHSTPTRPLQRRGKGRQLVLAASVLAIAAALVAWFALRSGEPAVSPAASPVASLARQWKELGLASAVPPGFNPRTVAEQRVAAGRAALAADLPERLPEAIRAFRDALAADPARLDALSGWVIALASESTETIRGEDLATAHELLAWARERSPDDAGLAAAYVRLLLAVPAEQNRTEALKSAWKAGALAPKDPDARLAMGLARLEGDPPGAVRVLDAELDRPGIDRRLLTAAARARWAAGDADRAFALCEQRLALDRGHPSALELEAEILLAGGQIERARGVLERYAAAHPESPRPFFLLARLVVQLFGRLPEGRILLERALALRPDDFLAARILAQLAAVERAAGDGGAAQRAVDAALQRVPASAPAQYQATLLSFARGDARAVREAAGVVGDRGGPIVAAAVRARASELSATAEDAAAAWEATADADPKDPTSALVGAGALARLGFARRALALADRAFMRDLAEARLLRPVSDFWDGAPPLQESSRRLVAASRGEARDAGRALAAAATAELLLGHARRVEELGRRAASLAPQLASVPVLLGCVALERGDSRATAAWAASALELHPGLPAALALRARSLEAVGKRVEAQRAWREALDAAPDLVTGRLALARLLVVDGKAEEARSQLEALVRDEPWAVEAAGALAELRRTRSPTR
jgi:tetratricopeptide (TPR) repeat protein